MQSVLVNSLLYYSKPTLGNNNSASDTIPLQLVHPNGCIQLGLVEKNTTRIGLGEDLDNPVVVVSNSNEKFASDMKVKDAIALGIVILGVVNIILTCLLYVNAEIVDPSKLVHNTGKKS